MHSTEYYEERLLELESEYERRIEALEDKIAVLREALETARPYVEGEGSATEQEQVRAALRVAL